MPGMFLHVKMSDKIVRYTHSVALYNVCDSICTNYPGSNEIEVSAVSAQVNEGIARTKEA